MSRLNPGSIVINADPPKKEDEKKKNEELDDKSK